LEIFPMFSLKKPNENGKMKCQCHLTLPAQFQCLLTPPAQFHCNFQIFYCLESFCILFQMPFRLFFL
jgi:hypothetical protein